MKNFNLLNVLTFFVLVVGGLGANFLGIGRFLGAIWGLTLLVFIWLKNKKILLPKGFLLFLLVLALMCANLFWSHNVGKSLEYILLFWAGGAFWVSFYNLPDKFKDFEKMVIILGVTFGLFYLGARIFGITPVGNFSLYFPELIYKNHNHLGDLWGVILAILAGRMLIKLKNWDLILSFFGVYFLAISLSRSAFVSLAVGVIYLFIKKGLFKKYKKVFWGYIGLASLLFVFVGFQKTLIFSRPYFIQAALGLLRNLFGVGMGNFAEISLNPQNHIWGFSGFATIVHNLVFEFFAGMGILGVAFLTWLIGMVRDVWERTIKENMIYALIFLTITANFLFDSTYFVPSMVYLWFMSLGLAQAKNGLHR